MTEVDMKRVLNASLEECESKQRIITRLEIKTDEQVKKIKELEWEIKNSNKFAQDQENKVKELEAENTKLRESLDFYARFNRWEYRDKKGIMVAMNDGDFEFIHHRAEKALSKEGEG